MYHIVTKYILNNFTQACLFIFIHMNTYLYDQIYIQSTFMYSFEKM